MSLSDKIKELEDKYKFERLEKQLFIGKVIEEIGFEKEQAKQICIRTMETDDIPIVGTMNDYFNDVFNYVINKQQEQ